MSDKESIEIAFSWFDEEQWNLLKALHPEGLDDTYEIWRKNANNAFTELESNGHTVRKIAINVFKLKSWCNENGKKPNGKARAEYASYLLAKLKDK